MQRRFLKPEVEFVTAAVARLGWRLRLAFGTVGRTGNADMKMLGVAPPRPHLRQPIAVCSSLATQRFLDRGIDENAGHDRILGCGADEFGIRMCPDIRIDIK